MCLFDDDDIIVRETEKSSPDIHFIDNPHVNSTGPVSRSKIDLGIENEERERE